MIVDTGVALIVAETQTLCKGENREKTEKMNRRSVKKGRLFLKRHLYLNFLWEKSDIFEVDRGCYNKLYNGIM